MNKALRKKHVQVWILLAALLPIGIVSAWLVVPGTVSNQLLQPGSSTALPEIMKAAKRSGYTVRLRTDAKKSIMQLEWINSSALTIPSAIIYQLPPGKQATESMAGAGLIGRIDSRGTYHFALKNDTAVGRFHFIVYDVIHHQVIDRINF